MRCGLITDRAPNAAATPVGPFADVKSQKTFEKGLLEKTAKQTGDIILCMSSLHSIAAFAPAR